MTLIDYKTFTVSEWSGFTIAQWAGLLIEPAAKVFNVMAVGLHTQGGTAGAASPLGSTASGIDTPGQTASEVSNG